MSTDAAKNIDDAPIPRGRPKSLSDADRQNRIIEAAMARFVELGFARTTMTDIAQRASMSKRDLYRHFPDKTALFAATIAARRHLILDLPRPEGEGLPLREAIRRVFRLDLDAREAAERDALMNLINRESLLLPELNALIYDSGALHSRELVVDWLEQEMAAGRIPQADSGRIAGMMMDLVFGVLLPKRQRKAPVDRSAQAEEILTRLEIVLAGLAATQ